MICKKCKLEAKVEGYCRTHYIEYKMAQFADNSSVEDYKTSGKGILSYLKFFYPEHYRDDFCEAHINVYKMVLELYDERYTMKEQRLRELIAFREFAKSKIIFGLISYAIGFNDKKIIIKANDGKISEVTLRERLMVIFSETGGMSEDFVTNIRNEFSTNRTLRYFFPFQIEDAIDSLTGQWTKTAFRINNMYVLGLGSGQQARGKIKGAYRPTFTFFDDIYSENNTLTKERRIKVKKWFYDAAINTMDNILGKALLAGTIINRDTVLVECENSNLWRCLKYIPMPRDLFSKFVKEYLITDTNNETCKLPFEDEEKEFIRIAKQKDYFRKIQDEFDWQLTWGSRVDLFSLALKYKLAVENANIKGFYQEYFHVVMPDETRKFSTEYFQEIPEYELFDSYGYTWFKCKKLYKSPQIVNIEIGIDLSSGLIEGDYVGIGIAGILPDGRLLILDAIQGKFSMRDIMNYDINRADKVIEDKSYVKHIGYIDELFRLSLIYKPKLIKVGTGGGLEPSVVHEIRRIFRANDLNINIVPRPQYSSEGKKYERIMNTLLPYYEAMRVRHKKGLNRLETQLEDLPAGDYDDLADAVECAVFNIRRPIGVDFSLFEKDNRHINRLIKKTSTEYYRNDWRIN